MKIYEFSMNEVLVFFAFVNLVISFFMSGDWQGFSYFMGVYLGNMIFISIKALVVGLLLFAGAKNSPAVKFEEVSAGGIFYYCYVKGFIFSTVLFWALTYYGNYASNGYRI